MDEYRRRRLQKKAFEAFGPPISNKRFPVSLNISLIDFSSELEGIMRVMNGHYVPAPYAPIHVEKRLVPGIHSNLAKDIAGVADELSKKFVRESFLVHQEIPHQLEFVAKVDGVTYIDNSSSTCVNSAWFALEEQNSPLVWIVGGSSNENIDYSVLTDLVKKKVKAIICLSKNEKVHTAFGSIVSFITTVNTMKDCIDYCRMYTRKGDTVLLSPVEPSFNKFEDHKDKGDEFKMIVMSL